MSDWIDIKDAKEGLYIFSSEYVHNFKLVIITTFGSIFDMQGVRMGDTSTFIGYVKRVNAVDLCQLMSGES